MSELSQDLAGTQSADGAGLPSGRARRRFSRALSANGPRRRTGKHADEGHELGTIGGLAALSLDALSSVAYGPEAMIQVLITAGTGALRFASR